MKRWEIARIRQARSGRRESLLRGPSRIEIHGGTGPVGKSPQFANTGTTEYRYYIVAQQYDAWARRILFMQASR